MLYFMQEDNEALKFLSLMSNQQNLYSIKQNPFLIVSWQLQVQMLEQQYLE